MNYNIKMGESVELNRNAYQQYGPKTYSLFLLQTLVLVSFYCHLWNK